MKVLVVGDIVGRPGRNTLQVFLEKYKDNWWFWNYNKDSR